MRTVYIEDNTPEGKWLFELIKNHKSVSYEPQKQEQAGTGAWQKAIAAGAVSVDTFFDELDARIENWPTTRA